MTALRIHLASYVADFERLGNETAIVSRHGVREVRTTYAELATLARRFACELQSRGLGKGDRVLLWGENSPQWIAAFFGCVLTGCLPVPLDSAGSESFARAVAADTTPKLMLVDDHHIGVFGDGYLGISLQSCAANITTRTDFEVPERHEDDPLQIIFTSGTTGQPKGIVHTHRNVLASIRPIEEEMRKYLRFERPFHPIRILHTLPLSHVFGQFMGLWIPALLGAESHVENRVVASELVRYIRTRRVSVLAAVPRVLDLLQVYLEQSFPDLHARLASAKGTGALSRWWHFRDVHTALGLKFWAFVCGGASLSARSEQFWNGLGFVVIQGYGMTETTALVSLNHPFKLARGTVGQILPGREIRLSPEGEVLVRGETISNATWQGGQVSTAESEWLATGDLAELDESGNLVFRGRRKEVIVTSAGVNIYPSDLEAALDQQPEIRSSAVLEGEGNAGPEPVAIILLRHPGNRASAEDAVSRANQELSESQRIRRWFEWPEADFPRTPTGKILKRQMAERLRAGDLATSTAGGTEELELDSLGRVELQAQLEARYGIALDDAALQTVRTKTDLTQLIRDPMPLAPARSPKQLDHWYPRWPWLPIFQIFRGVFLELVAIPLVRLLAKPTCYGTVHLPDGPILLIANHVTSYDVPLLLYALPGSLRRHVAVAMSGEMILDWRLARRQGSTLLNALAPAQYWLVTALFNIFPLPQLSGFRQSFQHAGDAVNQGYSVLVFPEGRRSDDGRLQPFKSGAGLLWKNLGIPALPLHLEGLGEIKRTGVSWFRSGSLSVRVGQPLSAPNPTQSVEELTQILQESVELLQSR